MAFVDLHPTTLVAEELLSDNLDTIRALLRAQILEIWEVPNNDIIIVEHESTVRSMDPIALEIGTAPDVLVKISTSDPLQDMAAKLRDRIIEGWKKLDEEIPEFPTAEVWIDFFHTWGATFEIPEE